MRITAVANTWRKVEGMKWDSWISRKRIRKVINSCVTTVVIPDSVFQCYDCYSQMVNKNVCAVRILSKQGPGVTDVTNGSLEQIKASIALPRAFEILTNQGPAESAPTTTANMRHYWGLIIGSQFPILLVFRDWRTWLPGLSGYATARETLATSGRLGSNGLH